MATVISQSISDVDMELLKYQIWDENNENNPADLWSKSSLTGKLNACYLNMKSQWVPILMDDPSISAISASKDEFVNQVINHPSYKTRWHNEMSGSIG